MNRASHVPTVEYQYLLLEKYNQVLLQMMKYAIIQACILFFTAMADIWK